MPEQNVHICNDMNRDQQIRAKAIEISAKIYAARLIATSVSFASTGGVTRYIPQPSPGNPFLLARKIESYIRNDIIKEPTEYF